ncbi:shikimate dehydrogenase family protein [Sphingobacterium tabacisoli]|uniref:Shikimate dehydrogenase family protein n=1 Tax=Sphingobacterium tabacisoli TaxID=2044855 RepID=A0ABW5KYU5_9SPHI|nr:shikimate dehydrogenase [Sphingobacterium tabacisoli]
MIKLGLIGFPLGHSFSKNYYLSKFEDEEINDVNYDLYSLENINQFPSLFLNDNRFRGFNVTIPHKQTVMGFIDDLSIEAKEIGAVNCITVHRSEDKVSLKGYNTDAFGFETSLTPLLTPQHNRALVLGNGGAAKAILYTFEKLGIPYTIVSRSKTNGHLTYEQLNEDLISSHPIIVNCTPLGTFPNIEECPQIPYEYISNRHLLYDLIYNPVETLFLQKGRSQNAITKNGHEMLILQAEKNWQIWKDNF